MKGDPVIDVVGMSRRYGSGKEAFDAVRNLDLSVQEGELFGLLGTNGAGKTSTLEVIQAFREPVPERCAFWAWIRCATASRFARRLASCSRRVACPKT